MDAVAGGVTVLESLKRLLIPFDELSNSSRASTDHNALVPSNQQLKHRMVAIYAWTKLRTYEFPSYLGASFFGERSCDRNAGEPAAN